MLQQIAHQKKIHGKQLAGVGEFSWSREFIKTVTNIFYIYLKVLKKCTMKLDIYNYLYFG